MEDFFRKLFIFRGFQFFQIITPSDCVFTPVNKCVLIVEAVGCEFSKAHTKWEGVLFEGHLRIILS